MSEKPNSKFETTDEHRKTQKGRDEREDVCMNFLKK